MYHNFIGVDISKATFVSNIYGKNVVKTFDNNEKGFIAFSRFYKNELKGSLVVLEITGGYEMEFIRYFAKQGINIHRADGRKVKYFIKSLGKHGKSDGIDAMGLASYGFERHLSLSVYVAKENSQEKMQQLTQRNIDLKKILVQEKNRQEGPNIRSEIKASIGNIIQILEIECKTIEEQIQACIESNEEAQVKQKILTSVVGIGKKTASVLMSLLPELGQVSRREIASLVGVAPHPRESGARIGYRCTKGGRREVRSALFTAAMAASRSKGILGDFYRGLVARGKKKMVAQIALLRKLLVIANARMKEYYDTTKAVVV